MSLFARFMVYTSSDYSISVNFEQIGHFSGSRGTVFLYFGGNPVS